MQISELEILFAQHPEIRALQREVAKGRGTHVLVAGLYASSRALALAQMKEPLFVLLDDAEKAQYLYADLKALGAEVGFFPSSKRRRTIDDAAVIQRTETLTTLPRIIVTYPEAVAEPVPAKEELSAVSFQLKVGQEVQLSAISRQLTELGFEHVDFVFMPGQYAIRGGILDIYSYSHDNPYRIDFFGDEIDSIREFDIEDQLSKARVEVAEIVGQGVTGYGLPVTVTDYLSEETVWVSNDWSVVKFKLEGLGVTGYGNSIHRHQRDAA